MIKGVFAGFSDSKKILLLVVFALLGAFFFSLLGSAIVIIFYGFDGLNLISNVTIDPKTIDALKIVQISQTVGMFIIPGLFLAYLFSSNPKSYLGFTRTTSKSLFFVIAILLISLPGINFLASLNELIPLADWMEKMEANAEILTRAFLTTNSYGDLAINIIMVAILPAIGEEIVFRGILQKHFIAITRSKFWGVIIAALIFSAFHLQFKGFIPRFALGAMFGFFYAWSGNILLPMFAHFANNSIATIGYMQMEMNSVDPKMEDFGGFDYLWPIGLISIFVVIVLLLKFREENKKNTELLTQNKE